MKGVMAVNYQRFNVELENGIVMEHYLPSRTERPNPMFFVHGNFCGSWCWRNFLTYFASRGTPCYAVNFRGHWLSDGHAKLGEAITEDYVRDVEECVEAISAEVILVGHSMGGIVSQKVAENNRVKSLVLLDSAPCKTITESCFQSRPETNQVIQDLFKPEPDGTVVMKRDKEKIKQILFEKDNVADETLAQAVAYMGRESALVLKNHAFLAVDPKKIGCPVYVMARKGMGNDKNPDLWHALADYYNAADRFISGDMSHNMFMENNWEEHAARIEKWCFGE
jgi:pimeloyl-ACP methyl ester carboxylesterase